MIGRCEASQGQPGRDRSSARLLTCDDCGLEWRACSADITQEIITPNFQGEISGMSHCPTTPA